MTDLPHPSDSMVAERSGQTRVLLGTSALRSDLDRVMEETRGLSREMRFREEDLVAAVQDLYRLLTEDHDRPACPALLHEAMLGLNYTPAMLFNPRDLGEALARTYKGEPE